MDGGGDFEMDSGSSGGGGSGSSGGSSSSSGRRSGSSAVSELSLNSSYVVSFEENNLDHCKVEFLGYASILEEVDSDAVVEGDGDADDLGEADLVLEVEPDQIFADEDQIFANQDQMDQIFADEDQIFANQDQMDQIFADEDQIFANQDQVDQIIANQVLANQDQMDQIFEGEPNQILAHQILANEDQLLANEDQIFEGEPNQILAHQDQIFANQELLAHQDQIFANQEQIFEGADQILNGGEADMFDPNLTFDPAILEGPELGGADQILNGGEADMFDPNLTFDPAILGGPELGGTSAGTSAGPILLGLTNTLDATQAAYVLDALQKVVEVIAFITDSAKEVPNIASLPCKVLYDADELMREIKRIVIFANLDFINEVCSGSTSDALLAMVQTFEGKLLMVTEMSDEVWAENLHKVDELRAKEFVVWNSIPGAFFSNVESIETWISAPS